MVFSRSFNSFFNIWFLKGFSMLLFNQNNNFEKTQFWTVGVTSLRFYLDLLWGMLCRIKKDFYSLAGVHCEYLRTHKLGSCVFYIKQHVWADTVLKSPCVEFLNSLSLRDMGSLEDKKWFLSSHLLSLRIFEAEKFKNVDFQGK